MPLQYASDWIDWHPAPVYRVHGGDSVWGPYWHPTDEVTAATAGFFSQASHNRAALLYQRTFGGPYPSDDPLCGFLRGASAGLSGTFNWDGVCPTTSVGSFLNSSAGANDNGSFWEIANSARSGIGGGNQQVNALTDLSGWLLKPWKLYSNYPNEWMNDDALLAEYVAATSAAYPSQPGLWFVVPEASHPFFEGLEYAPDEPAEDGAGNPYDYSGAVHWLDISTGWGYYQQPGAAPIWLGDGSPSGDPVAIYEGLFADWMPVPSTWLPTQSDDPVVCEFVAPPDLAAEWDAAVPLTLAHEGIVNQSAYAGPEGTTTTAGRFHQTLAFRAQWRLPRFRYAREVPGTAKPRRVYPRDDGRTGGAPRGYPLGRSQLSRNRTVGGYL